MGFAQTAGGFQPMVVYCTKRRNDRLSNPSWPGLLVPAITTRTELAKDAIPVSKHPMEMAEPNLAKPDHDGVSGACSTSTAKTAGISPGHDESAARCRYVNASYIDPCVLG